jgi:RimJ/RimL family protein N-acetyltransferase
MTAQVDVRIDIKNHNPESGMNPNEIENNITKSTLLQIIHSELAELRLSTNDYIEIANSILDEALDKKQTNGAASGRPKYDVIKNLPATSGEIQIRPFDITRDMGIIHKWTTDQTGKEFLISRIENTSIALEELITSENNVFGMVTTASSKPIGILGFLNVDRQQNKAELRKLIGDPGERGMGYGKKATKLWLSYGIYGLNLRKIYLYTFDTNLRNIRINEELGFKLEGIFRAENIVDNTPKDIIRMGMIV